MSGRALFLDRDGVVNQDVNYLHRPQDVRWVEGIVPLCRTAQDLGYKLVIITNQAGIGRGLYTTRDFEELMAWMSAELARHGVRLDGVYHCPYHAEYGVGEFRREHEDRKPSPGMLLRAARELDLDLMCSVMVGDQCTDVAAAHAAGVRQAFLLSGKEARDCPDRAIKVDSLETVSGWLSKNS